MTNRDQPDFDNPGGEFSSAEVNEIEERAAWLARTGNADTLADSYNGQPWSQRSTFRDVDANDTPTLLDDPDFTIAEPYMDALNDLGWWDRYKSAQFGDDPVAESQAEETRESLQDELSEGRPEVTVGDIDTEPVREAVENAVPGTGNDAPGVEPTSSSGGAGGVGAVVAVVLALLAGAAALLGGED